MKVFPFVLLLFSCLCVAGTAQQRPNILLLMAEDMNQHVHAFGDPVAVTPDLDHLAAEGVRYPNTFATAGEARYV